MFNLFGNKISQSILLKSFVLSLLINLILVSNALAAPSTAALTATMNGDETGPASIQYTVTLDSVNDTGGTIFFEIDPTGGTATAGGDYVDFTGGAIAVLPGQTTGVFNVVVNDDLLFENTETVIATITDPVPPIVTIITPNATATITDDDNTAGSITADLATTTNGDETGPIDIVYTVTLSTVNNTNAAIDLPIAQTGGNAVSGSDYTAFTTISVPDGSNTGTLTVSVTDDNSIENLETLDVTLSAPMDPAIVVGVSMASASITDNDSGAGTVDADLSVTVDGDETGPVGVEYTVTLAKTNGTGAPFVFNIDPSAGTAIAGTDFTDFTGTGTVSIADGSNTGTFTATVLDDALLDDTRTLEATFSGAPHPAININTASATGNIADNDTADAVLSVTFNGNEAGPVSAEFTVTLSLQNDTGAPITFAINPDTGTATVVDDFADFTGSTISVSDGSSTGTFNVTVVDDALLESTETIGAIISSPSLASVSILGATASANILDNDTATVDISATTNGDEAGPVDGVFTVTLSKVNNTGSPITVGVFPPTGTATFTTDYNLPGGGSFSIPDGSSTATKDIQVVDDSLLESTETVILTIGSPSIPSVTIGTATDTANITDNDTANADLSVTVDGDETGTNIEYTVTLDKTNNTGSAITFDIDPTAGSATAGSDYVDFAMGGVISVADGSSTGTFTVTVTDDMFLEGTETVEATISNSSFAAVTITTASATADIADDETADADLSVTVHGDETGPVSIEYTVTLSSINSSGSGIDFDINPTGGNATATDDYTDFTGGTITIADGSDVGTIIVPVINDMLFENDETVEATISNPSLGVVNIVTPSATATITDNDNAAASVNADISVTTPGDEDGPVDVVYTVTLAKANNTHSPITFNIDPTAGTAVTPGDYTDFTGSSVTVADGSATGTFTVTVNDDAIFDGDRSVEATITNASDPAININTGSITANILDDEAPDADVSVTTNGDETGPVNIVYTVTLSLTNNTGGNVTLDIDPTAGNATAGNDFVDFAGSAVTIADGDSTGTITVTVNDDLLYENDENVVATISNPSHPNVNINTATADATIADDDNTGITTTFATTTTGDETGPVNLVYTVTISKVNNTHGDVTFDINPTGGNSNHTQDYTNFAGQTVTIADGTDTGTFTVAIVDDVRFENNETLISTISNVSDPAAITITTPTATGTIIDNDNAPGSVEAVLSRTSDGSETGSSLIGYTITLELPNHTHQPITFDIDPTAGTATAGVDYDDFATNTISVPDGSSFATILIPVNDDAILEGTETVEATIANATDPAIGITTASASANVLDDDDAVANLSVTTNGDENGPTSIVYTVTLTNTNNTGSSITFNINPTAGTATAGSDYTNFVGSTVSVADGSSTGTLTVIVSDDAAFENTETVQATISNSSSTDVTIGTAAATATITDNDNTSGSIAADLSVTTDGDETGPVNIVFTVTMASPNNTGSPVTFDISQFAGSATLVADFSFASNTVTIANGSSTGSVTVTVVDDALFENDESLEAAINNPSDPAVFINTPNATATITDNDNAAGSINGTLSSTQQGDEDGTDIVFTVTLDKANNTGSGIDFTISDGSIFVGTATPGSDYSAFDGNTITVPNGSTTGTLTVSVIDDGLFENTEIVVAGVFGSPDPAISISSFDEADIIDNDNDPESIDVSISLDGDGLESGPVDATYAVTLSTVNNTGNDIEIEINPTGGTATAGADYTDFSGDVVIIPNGSDTAIYTVSVSDDSLFENTETLTATISNPSDPALSISTDNATAEIVDNDNAAASVNAILSATTNGNEAGPVNVLYTVSLSTANNTGSPINFTINPTAGTATAGSDYVTFAGGTISVPTGSSSGTLSVTVANDTLFEATETLTATITSPSDPAVTITSGTVTANILDDDSATGTINADLSVTTDGSETGPTSIVYRVTLAEINNTGSAITFTINPTGGTATAGTDYATFAGGTVSVANGASFGTITVPVTNDSLFENTETVVATISAASNAAIVINTASASATITDNDNAVNSVNANLSATVNGNETGPVSIVYTVTLATANNTGSSIQFSINPAGGTALAGSDYTNFTGSIVTVANNATTGTLTVPVINDALFENTETVQAIITSPTDAAINIVTATASANIIDNDNTAASIGAALSATTNGNEAGPVSIVYAVMLTTANNSGSPINFTINPTGGTATAGSDYVNFAGGTISVPSGSTSGTLAVTVANDTLFESTETVAATISSPSDAAVTITTASATANIMDDDSVSGTINADLSVTTQGSEAGPTSIVYRVTLATINNTGSAVTFSINPTGGTATAGSDYTTFAGGTVSVANGASFGTLTVPVTNDSLYENTETVQATISSPSNAAITINTASAIANITDNDNAVNSVNANLSVTTNGSETGPTSIVYTVTLASVNNTGSAIQFSINPTGGTATATSDYTNFAGSLVTVANGASTGTLSVVVVNDALFENTETVQATISNPTDPAINIATGTVTANIVDNDNAAASVNANLSVTTHGSEVGTTNALYTLTLASVNNTGAPITFTINSTGGTASAGSDYINFSGTTLTIPNGGTAATQLVSVNDDSLFENTETIEATVSGASDPAINIVAPTATADITDNDNTNINTVLSVTQNGDEDGDGGTRVIYTVTLAKTNNTHAPITVNIDPNGGNATAGDDYSDFTGSMVIIDDGANTGTISIPVVDDMLFENTETLEASITNPSDLALTLGTSLANATIADNDNNVGSIAANFAATVDGDETGSVDGEFEVTIEKVNNTHGPITFDVTIEGGTANAPFSDLDYSDSLAGTVTIPDGSDTGVFLVTGVVDDTLFENTETVELSISNPSDPALFIDSGDATGNIIDSDNAPGSINADIEIFSDGGETAPDDVKYTVRLAKVNNTHQPITLSINPTGGSATAGSDYSDFTATTVTINHGVGVAIVEIPVVDDTLFENTETVEATISSPSDPALVVNTASITADITDNDNAAGSIDASISTTQSGNETGPVNIIYTVTLAKTNNTHGDITVDIDPSAGTADTSDYSNFAGGTVTISDGASTGTFTVSVLDDSVSENTENVEATISAASDPALNIATASATAEITDNDGFDLIEPIYSLWNGFLNHINIVALINKGSAVNNITVTLYDLDGNQLSVNNFDLNPGVQFDLIINQLPGYTANSYGSVKIEYTQPMSIEGQSSIYRVKPSSPTNYDYSLLRALSNKKTGKTYAFFNTFQPSLDPADAAIQVFSFAEIVNLSATTKAFKVEKFSDAGALISTETVSMPANGRRDSEAGHVTPGANNVGKIVVTPVDSMGVLDPTTEYMAQVATYGPSAVSGNFDFAFSEEFRSAKAEAQYINLSRGAGGNNWVAVANTHTATHNVNFKIINNAGVTVANSTLTLAAGAQTHISPDTALAAGESGVVVITPELGKTVLANGRTYFYDSTGSVTDASLQESRDILRGTLHSSYNTFLGQSNWVRAFNVGTNSVTINVEVLSLTGTSLGNTNLVIPAGSGRDFEISSSGIPVPVNSYGLVRVTSNDNPSIVAHMLRLKPGTGGVIDLGNTIPLR